MDSNEIDIVGITRYNYFATNLEDIISEASRLSNTIESIVMFINDQVYNYVLKLSDGIKKDAIYKQSIKKTFNEIDKSINRYNILMRDDSPYRIKITVIPEIEQLMKDDFVKLINEISDTTNEKLSIIGFKQDRIELATLSIIISCLSTISDKILHDGSKMLRNISEGFFEPEYTELDIHGVTYLSTKLSNYLTNGEIDLNKDSPAKISNAIDAFFNNVFDEKKTEILEIVKKHEDKWIVEDEWDDEDIDDLKEDDDEWDDDDSEEEDDEFEYI